MSDSSPVIFANVDLRFVPSEFSDLPDPISYPCTKTLAEGLPLTVYPRDPSSTSSCRHRRRRREKRERVVVKRRRIPRLPKVDDGDTERTPPSWRNPRLSEAIAKCTSNNLLPPPPPVFSIFVVGRHVISRFSKFSRSVNSYGF